MKSDDQRLDESDYTYYNYFREKPSVLITILTVAISFCSFIINIIVVNWRARYNSYWGFDGVGISYSQNNSFSLFFAIFVVWLC